MYDGVIFKIVMFKYYFWDFDLSGLDWLFWMGRFFFIVVLIVFEIYLYLRSS